LRRLRKRIGGSSFLVILSAAEGSLGISDDVVGSESWLRWLVSTDVVRQRGESFDCAQDDGSCQHDHL
jgi:hypothetical protein